MKTRRLLAPLYAATVAGFGSAIPGALSAQVSVDLPLGVGFHLPAYDRVNGLTLPYGPTISIGDDRVVAEPLITYRSNLGKFDPSLSFAWQPDSALSLSINGGRGTFTNDAWIRSDLVNSAYTLISGADTRNYYRADRGEGRVTLSFPRPQATSSLFVGTRFENAWTTGWRAGERRGAYSLFQRGDVVNGPRRPNPVVDRGHIASVLLGGTNRYEGERVTNEASVALEGAWHTPTVSRFQQLTMHSEGTLRTWRGQRVELTVHLLTTSNGATPQQRYSYLGGLGTLPTLNLLERGGDHLYFTDFLYVIPVPGAEVPVLGHLFVAPRFASGAAGVQGFGRPTHDLGVRVGGSFIRIDAVIDPEAHQRALAGGFSFSR